MPDIPHPDTAVAVRRRRLLTDEGVPLLTDEGVPLLVADEDPADSLAHDVETGERSNG